MYLQIIDDKDEFMYLGTRTGDIMQVPYYCNLPVISKF
jgi:hypothetical protein